MGNSVEKAFFASNTGEIEKLGRSLDRVYFGREFCERLLPSKKEVVLAKGLCEKHGISFSLVTPFLSDKGLSLALKLAKSLSKEDELVVNDYGLLHSVNSSNLDLQFVAGRLLNRQYRDPRISSFKGRVPEDFLLHLTQSSASSKEFQKFLLQNNVKRVEFDNLLQGTSVGQARPGLRYSLYSPFVFVSTSRMCLSANCDRLSFHNRVGVLPCNKECLRYSFVLKNRLFKQPLFLFGNTVFFRNEKLPGKTALLKGNFDRLVSNRGLGPEQD